MPPLHNGHLAQVDMTKLLRYCLDEHHGRGGH